MGLPTADDVCAKEPALLKKRPLILFFLLAFVLPWFAWGTAIAQDRGLLGWHLPGSLAFWLGLPIATFAAAALTGGRPAVRDLLLRLVRVRVRWHWYAVAALLTPALAVVAVLAGSALGWPAAVGALVPPSGLFALVLLDVWLFLVTEEMAWRGFALPRLQARMSALPAALLLGLIWGLWHIPLFLTAGSFQSGLPFAGFLVSIVATSVLTSWIFNHTRGGVLPAAVFHATTDTAIAFWGVMGSGSALFWLFVVLQCGAAGAVAPSLQRLRAPSGELVFPPQERHSGELRIRYA